MPFKPSSSHLNQTNRKKLPHKILTDDFYPIVNTKAGFVIDHTLHLPEPGIMSKS